MRLEPLERKAQREQQELPVHKEIPEPLVHKDQWELLEQLVHKALKAQLELQVL